MNKIKIGLFLRELREEKNMTQEELAILINSSNKTISRWENGHYLPTVEMLDALAKVYSISITEILSGERINDKENNPSIEVLKQKTDDIVYSSLIWNKSSDIKLSLFTIFVINVINIIVTICLLFLHSFNYIGYIVSILFGLSIFCVFSMNGLSNRISYKNKHKTLFEVLCTIALVMLSAFSFAYIDDKNIVVFLI